MDSSEFPAGRSPRRTSDLQGPRPTPLKVRKDSYKIRKPPMAPQPSQPYPQQPRPPIIIYAVSPKVIHTNPSEFMALVQRLTGLSSSSSSTSSAAAAAATTSANYNPWSTNNNGAISPAARFASIEKTRSSPQGKKPSNIIGSEDLEVIEGIEIINHGVERTSNSIPGILSPGPGSLQPIPSAFFSPPSDQNPLGFLHDLSPAIYSTKHNHLMTDNSFLIPSPTTTFVSPHNLTSPFPSLDLFNNFFDL